MSARRCTSCGHPNMIYATDHSETITVGSLTKVISGLSGWFCPECGDGRLEDASSYRFGAAGDDLVRQHREQIKRDIRRIRRKLGLTQKQAAAIFGGGVNAFSRYERGEVEPATATLKLLQLLDKHPELLQEVVNG